MQDFLIIIEEKKIPQPILKLLYFKTASSWSFWRQIKHTKFSTFLQDRYFSGCPEASWEHESEEFQSQSRQIQILWSSWRVSLHNNRCSEKSTPSNNHHLRLPQTRGRRLGEVKSPLWCHCTSTRILHSLPLRGGQSTGREGGRWRRADFCFFLL